jgi:flagella basal body P-ring formation protein FlgA
MPGAAEDIRLAPTPTATIYPGDPITSSSVSMRRFYARTLRRAQAVERMEDAVGKVARRTLAPGRPIPASALVAPSAVSRGVPAPMVYRHGGLTITGRGTPLRSAAVGEMVEVRNVESGTVVTGRVTAGGVIEVGGP